MFPPERLLRVLKPNSFFAPGFCLFHCSARDTAFFSVTSGNPPSQLLDAPNFVPNLLEIFFFSYSFCPVRSGRSFRFFFPNGMPFMSSLPFLPQCGFCDVFHPPALTFVCPPTAVDLPILRYFFPAACGFPPSFSFSCIRLSFSPFCDFWLSTLRFFFGQRSLLIDFPPCHLFHCRPGSRVYLFGPLFVSFRETGCFLSRLSFTFVSPHSPPPLR